MSFDKPAALGGNPVRKTPLRFGVPTIRQDEINAVIDVLKSGWISTGPKNREFEERFKSYTGAKNAIAVSSCTDAMELSLVVGGISKGDEIITTPMTFTATANVIIHQGAIPVFADIDKYTLNINPLEIEKRITSKTRAIMPVHYAGQPCQMDEIINIAKDHNLMIFEDAAHGLGAEYNGRKIGTIGDTTSFSFHVQKNLTTAEGGMLTTDNDDWANRLKILRLHGMTKDAWGRTSGSQVHYDVVFPGYKCNMTDIQAALGLAQLNKLEDYISIRQKYAKIYNNAFRQIPQINLLKRIDSIRHSENMYVIMLNLEMLTINRDEFIKYLQAENIFCAVHFKPVHLHSYYANTFGYKRGDYPNAEYAFDRVITLPLSPMMTENDVHDVILAVTKLTKYFKR